MSWNETLNISGLANPHVVKLLRSQQVLHIECDISALTVAASTYPIEHEVSKEFIGQIQKELVKYIKDNNVIQASVTPAGYNFKADIYLFSLHRLLLLLTDAYNQGRLNNETI